GHLAHPQRARQLHVDRPDLRRGDDSVRFGRGLRLQQGHPEDLRLAKADQSGWSPPPGPVPQSIQGRLFTVSESPLSTDAGRDPVEEFRAALIRAPGDWYVVHSYAGYENRVKANLENRTASLNMEDFIFQVEVPQEDIVEFKNSQRKQVRRNMFPGYVLVRMD